MPRYARNDIKCVARKSIKSARKFYYYFPANKPLLRSVRSTLSLREAKRRGNLPEGTPHYKTHARYLIMGPNGILCTRWEKEYASVRQTFVACDDCLVKNEAYDAEKKAHTSKRVSIIACNNVISKVQLPGTPRDTVYPRGKGAHKHKSEHCRKRQCDFKSAVCAMSSPVNVTFCPSTSSAQINLR